MAGEYGDEGFGIGRKMRMGRWAGVCGAWLVCGSLAGCAAIPGHPPVPPLVTEGVPAPPPSRTVLIFQPGHWDWTGARYRWVTGMWVERSGHGTLWQDGYWDGVGAGTVWVPGHWL